MMNRKQRMPWWFWLTVIAAFGLLNFIPLLVLGSKIKQKKWTMLGMTQLGLWVLLIVMAGMAASNPTIDNFGETITSLLIAFSIGLIFYMIFVVRTTYLREMEIQAAMKQPQQNMQSQPESPHQPATPTAQLAKMHAWSCTGCGAENNNAAAVCEYCGVAMKSS
ncbi:MAG: tweety family protein [Turicibacter sp.]|nr:tweety family protein [Turicibacter sp.]